MKNHLNVPLCVFKLLLQPRYVWKVEGVSFRARPREIVLQEGKRNLENIFFFWAKCNRSDFTLTRCWTAAAAPVCRPAGALCSPTPAHALHDTISFPPQAQNVWPQLPGNRQPLTHPPRERQAAETHICTPLLAKHALILQNQSISLATLRNVGAYDMKCLRFLLMRSLELRFFPSQLSTLQITVAWNKLLYICFKTDWSGELIGGSENCVFAIQIQMEWLIYWQPPGEFGWRGECASFSRRWTAHSSMFFFLTASRLAHTLWAVLSVWNRKTWRRASRWWSHMSTRLYSNVCPLLLAD